VLIAIEHLLIKLHQPRSRADELVALRRRVRDARGEDADADERALARELKARKAAIAEQLAAVASCGSCATGAPWPRGAHDGGACCAGVTGELFDDDEVAALVQAGTRPRDLSPPDGADAHAGCAFRGPRGCTLAVTHRPSRCVHYVCDTLRAELHARGQLAAVEASLVDLARTKQRFAAAHRARVDRTVRGQIVDALAAAAPATRRPPRR
jgi:hypothetical protein